jgi:hypothetical protein
MITNFGKRGGSNGFGSNFCFENSSNFLDCIEICKNQHLKLEKFESMNLKIKIVGGLGLLL